MKLLTPRSAAKFLDFFPSKWNCKLITSSLIKEKSQNFIGLVAGIFTSLNVSTNTDKCFTTLQISAGLTQAGM